ncbi:39S ribosomal protein L39, mitochondrial-like [Anneissia japonica]|uniref:39S ribosomal protein L39, mitochondrial-like n=1 Tax=Anneissia japonica TaxID=1529436 RepID=UPI0014257BB3|nr:39S ribosomal protein L39, mitochondrial-like [Anneissia japonica]
MTSACFLRRRMYFQCRRCFTNVAKQTTPEPVMRQNKLFDEEAERQLQMVKRLEKINVQHLGPNDKCTFVMNKKLSTPYHCAMHLNERYVTNSGLALVNGEPWHMHQPLQEDCELKFLTFKDDDVEHINMAFWKASAHLMGAVLHSAFKDMITTKMVYTPHLPVSAGCFAHDISLPFHWRPTFDELMMLNRQAYRLIESKIPFERLQVSSDLAITLFNGNEFKTAEVKRKNVDCVTLYRLGKFIDLSDGPMISNSQAMSVHRFSFTNVHLVKGDADVDKDKIHRFQGVALPSAFEAHYSTWSTLENRARKPVKI